MAVPPGEGGDGQREAGQRHQAEGPVGGEEVKQPQQAEDQG
jgi:hypothetical protein